MQDLINLYLWKCLENLLTWSLKFRFPVFLFLHLLVISKRWRKHFYQERSLFHTHTCAHTIIHYVYGWYKWRHKLQVLSIQELTHLKLRLHCRTFGDLTHSQYIRIEGEGWANREEADAADWHQSLGWFVDQMMESQQSQLTHPPCMD